MTCLSRPSPTLPVALRQSQSLSAPSLGLCEEVSISGLLGVTFLSVLAKNSISRLVPVQVRLFIYSHPGTCLPRRSPALPVARPSPAPVPLCPIFGSLRRRVTCCNFPVCPRKKLNIRVGSRSSPTVHLLPSRDLSAPSKSSTPGS